MVLSDLTRPENAHPLKKFLRVNGISQDKLAKKMKVPVSQLNRILNGSDAPKALKKRCDDLAKEWRVQS